MKTMKHSILLLAMTGCAILAGCASDGSGDKGPAPEPAQVKTLSVEGLSDDRWVYISLETGSKVGESPLGDAAQDAAWKTRTDWDIALCGELIRTNGGTSGNGQGAVQRVQNKSFNALDQAPADGYTTDTDDIVIRR